MNKRGLIGKIFAVIGILLIIVIIIAGVTAYQVYGVVKEFQEKTPVIQENVQQLTAGDCTKLAPVESDISSLKTKITGACKNPIIKIAVQKIDQVPLKCDQISSLEEQITTSLKPIKEYCGNKTLKA